MSAFRVCKIRVEEISVIGAVSFIIILCSTKEIDHRVVGLMYKKRLTKSDALCLSTCQKLNAVEFDKPEEDECEDISGNKENASQKSENHLELKDG